MNEHHAALAIRSPAVPELTHQLATDCALEGALPTSNSTDGPGSDDKNGTVNHGTSLPRSDSMWSSGSRSLGYSETWEDPRGYYLFPDGLYPVNLKDVFDNRFRIIHKLGHGAHSTVWLAENLLFSSTEKSAMPCYVALKFFTAEQSSREGVDGKGMKIIKALGLDKKDDTPGHEKVVKFYGMFNITGQTENLLCTLWSQ